MHYNRNKSNTCKWACTFPLEFVVRAVSSSLSQALSVASLLYSQTLKDRIIFSNLTYLLTPWGLCLVPWRHYWAVFTVRQDTLPWWGRPLPLGGILDLQQCWGWGGGGLHQCGIHVNAETCGFPPKHCIVMWWSRLFPLSVSGFNIVEVQVWWSVPAGKVGPKGHAMKRSFLP